MRLGKDKTENLVFFLPLHSPFAIFTEDRMRLGKHKTENFVFLCLCARLSLYLL